MRCASAGQGSIGNRALPVLLLSGALALLTGGAGAETAGDAGANSCVECHRDPAFMVRNKGLYDYYQAWESSVHKQEGLTCEDCHGGNPAASDKRRAHGRGVATPDSDSGIHFTKVVSTCGTCHSDVIEGFTKSAHFQHVNVSGAELQGPTCVTCHGSMNTTVLDVNSIEMSCARCHNEETGNHPENTGRARDIMNRILSIHRLQRYLRLRLEPDAESQDFFREIDRRERGLATTWHAFDMSKVDAETREILDLLKAKRDEVRRARAAARGE